MIDQIIIIKSYNDEDTIKRCIKSVISQKNFNDLKLYIIDDGSSDKTQDIIKSFKNYFFNMDLRQEKLGPSSNLNDYNKIIKNYSNGYVVILSGDDYFPIDKTNHHEEIFSNKDIGLHFGNGFVKNTNNDVTRIYRNKIFLNKDNIYVNLNKKIYLDLIENNYIPSFASAYSIKYLKKIGGFKCIPNNNLSVHFSTICILSTISKFFYTNHNLGYLITTDSQKTLKRISEQILLDYEFIKYFNEYLYQKALINILQKKILFYKSLKFKNYIYFNNLKKSIIDRKLLLLLSNFIKIFVFPSSLLIKIKSILILMLYPFPNIFKKIFIF